MQTEPEVSPERPLASNARCMWGSRGHPLEKLTALARLSSGQRWSLKDPDWRQAAGRVSQLCEFDGASARPFVARTSDDESAIVKEHFGGDIFFNKFGNARKNNINLPFSQVDELLGKIVDRSYVM